VADFGLSVQQLARGTDRVLVVGDLVGSQHGDGWFSPSAVAGGFEAFRLPSPGNVSQALAQLRKRGLVVRRSGGGEWSLTPIGRQQVLQLMGGIDAKAAEAETMQPSGAELFHAVHMLIPPFFAPARWAQDIARFLREYDFDRNVFCMTRFPGAEHESDPVQTAIDAMRAALQEHGLVLHLASDRNIVDDLWGNVAAHGWACRYGIGIFEDRIKRGLNYNLVAELGAMLMTGRRCAFLKDVTQSSLPSDFVGQLYKEVDLDDMAGVAAFVHDWVTHDLGLP
jgi:hypothetical protein